jgi:hypothetical protein
MTGNPSIILINIHGVVDVEGVGIPERELMGHVLINSIATINKDCPQPDLLERYAYQREGHFVNEYGRTYANGITFEGDPDNPNHLLGSFPTLFPGCLDSICKPFEVK